MIGWSRAMQLYLIKNSTTAFLNQVALGHKVDGTNDGIFLNSNYIFNLLLINYVLDSHPARLMVHTVPMASRFWHLFS